MSRYLPTRPGPLLALSATTFVFQLELVGFATLAPDIRDAFGLSDTAIGAIANASSVSALLAAWPIGRLADRFSRRASIRIGAVTFVAAAFATAFAGTVHVLVAARLVAGLPPMAADIVQPGVLGDLYGREDHPKVFAVWRGAATVGGVSALLLGAVAALLDWRAAFVIAALLGVAVLGPAWRVPEPPCSTLPAPGPLPEVAVPGLARRRWLWVTAFFFGASTISLTTILSLFFDDVYGTGPFGRGAVVAVLTAGTLVGLVAGTPLAERDDRLRGTAGLVGAMTWSLVLLTAAVPLVALAPVLVLSLVGVAAGSVAIGMLLVAFYPLILRSSPAGQRSITFAKITFVAGCGAIASLPLFTVGDEAGYRITLLCVAALVASMACASAMLRRDQVRSDAIAPSARP